jgi:predicted phosphodiesterase
MLLGIISDIHEDIQNLEKAFEKLDELNVSEIICLGDIVGFNTRYFELLKPRNANACINLVKNRCKLVMAGNHDQYAIRKTPSYSNSFDFGQDWYMLDYEIRKKRGEGAVWLYEPDECESLIGDSEKNFLDELPEFSVMPTEENRLLFTHYIYPDLTGSTVKFVEDPAGFEAHFAWMKIQNCDFSFSGHAHTEGMQIASHKSVSVIPFEKQVLLGKDTIVVGPAIISTGKQNGVLVFNTNTFEACAHPLKN